MSTQPTQGEIRPSHAALVAQIASQYHPLAAHDDVEITLPLHKLKRELMDAMEAVEKHQAEQGAHDADLEPEQLCAMLEAKGAFLTPDIMDAMETFWESHRATRRCALALLTKPFSWLREQVREDRDFAVAVAQISVCLDGQNFYRDVQQSLEQASLWATVALCERTDMAELLAEAERGEG